MKTLEWIANTLLIITCLYVLGMIAHDRWLGPVIGSTTDDRILVERYKNAAPPIPEAVKSGAPQRLFFLSRRRVIFVLKICLFIDVWLN